ncbi:nucleotidyltransferase family protein [Endozoicomonas sp. SM1973]|uniref:Nucleotidyltransferase family protein n=1 Tax=Spartinivicinus marinus TaxID=2994442 RepID=A0A853IKV9_9GAMM|nr:nucleotidyltransferase family protein [Spartinivicinus marinus]MCX4028028.1 nucleotidyltransferase family protein [Spartinivicinus marinus]NYZ68346.1 nucleotidyltransferase family protein [Spartinivicinus marinus]
MKAIILAAGLGTRMRPLTLKTPKPLLPVLGKPLIEYQLERLAAAGITELVINHAYLGEQIESYLKDGSRWGVNISYSPEPEPLETAGGITHALSLLGNAPFIVINSDIWCDYPLEQLHLPENNLAHLVLVDNPDHNVEGDFSLIDGLVTLKSRAQRFTFTGISVLSPALFNKLPQAKWPLAPVLKEAIDQGLVSGEQYHGYWLDVGTPERLKQLENDLVAKTAIVEKAAVEKNSN